MKLSIVVGTYNRLELLKKCIDSVFSESESEITLYVTDAGSTDGTIEYLKSIASDKIKPIFEGRKMGQAKAYNIVFRQISTPYVCWLSDDNVIVNHGLDTAVKILEKNRNVGMVGLKVKDKLGPFVDAPYIGGVSSVGILNVNQGVLPTNVLKDTGYFSEEFMDYGIDPDLTAKVLLKGFKIVYTKDIAIHHYRDWAEDKDSPEYAILQEKHKKFYNLYEEKYSSISSEVKEKGRMKNLIYNNRIMRRVVNSKAGKRDVMNILKGKFISSMDPLISCGKCYHLVQKYRQK